jgi:hypothetical protein
MKEKTSGRALFYNRDSGGKHEATPTEYVGWAMAEAQKRGLGFDGSPELIQGMIRGGEFASGDLYLDYDVKGNVLRRDGLDALMNRVAADRNVTHVFIPRRDRLARPDCALDGVGLENKLRAGGVTVVFMDKELPPIVKGRRQDLGDLILSVIDYNAAGEFRQELAEKIILAQISLAKQGFSTGGRAQFGFRRWLVTQDGKPVRQLEDGERIRRAGHHVVKLPGPDTELNLVRRILILLETTPASRVAAILNQEGIRSPDSGRYRTDSGVRHKVSGLWHQPTVVNIARNRLLVAVATYGQRSMGDQMRLAPQGRRLLAESDFRADNQPKVIRNPASHHITAKSPSAFEPVVEPEKFERLQEILDQRAGTQRGKSRAADPMKNPLGARIFDLNCTWPMYRVPYGNSFRYTCGLYQQTHGKNCHHNHIDGVLATRLALSCLQQRLLSPEILEKLKERLRQLVEADHQEAVSHPKVAQSQDRLDQVRRDLKLAERNLAFAENEDQFKAIAAVVEELRQREAALAAESLLADARDRQRGDVDAEIDAVLKLADHLVELVSGTENCAVAKEAIELANVRIFLSFRPVRRGKRLLNQVTGGVVTIGAAPPPVALYEGPTSRHKIKRMIPRAATAATKDGGRRSPTDSEPNGSGREGTSLGNVNRGDRI